MAVASIACRTGVILAVSAGEREAGHAPHAPRSPEKGKKVTPVQQASLWWPGTAIRIFAF